MSKGRLYLIPTVIAEGTEDAVISKSIKEVISNLDYFLVENVRTARRYISKLKLGLNIEDLQFEILDKKSSEPSVAKMLDPVLSGKDVGIISESGCPGVADPGSLAVAYAHKVGIQVVPLSGPSSILMALMASGFNGQSFVFHGYVPIDKREILEKIRRMEADATKLGQTQIFMDTPYRNERLFDAILENGHPNTRLSIAKDITGSNEMVKTKTLSDWKKSKPKLHKIPVIFSLMT